MAALKTARVRSLVREVIDGLPRPLTEHVTLEVFKEIERSPARLNEYHTLCVELSQRVVNQWIGRWTLDALGAESIEQVTAEGTTLTETYSTLRFVGSRRDPA